MVLETAQIDRLLSRTKEAESQAAVMAGAEPDGNVLRMPAQMQRARVHAMPAQSAGPAPEPVRGLAWWRSQVWGLAIGFCTGVVAGAWIVRMLAG
jgi:hypothetical protein